MKKYFTSISTENNNFIGSVYDEVTNQLLYKSKPYNTQSQAMQDINTFLITQNPPKTEPVAKPQTIVNTAVHVSGVPKAAKRCCGR